MQWHELWKILFRVTLEEKDSQNIEDWLDSQFKRGVDRGWDGEELKAALNTYAENARKEGHRLYAPTVPQIKTQIIRNRWSKRSYEPEREKEICGLCGEGTGLILVWPEATEPPWTWERLAHEYQRTTPCRCKKGKKLTQYMPEEPIMFELARKQNAGRNQSGYPTIPAGQLIAKPMSDGGYHCERRRYE